MNWGRRRGSMRRRRTSSSRSFRIMRMNWLVRPSKRLRSSRVSPREVLSQMSMRLLMRLQASRSKSPVLNLYLSRLFRMPRIRLQVVRPLHSLQRLSLKLNLSKNNHKQQLKTRLLLLVPIIQMQLVQMWLLRFKLRLRKLRQWIRLPK